MKYAMLVRSTCLKEEVESLTNFVSHKKCYILENTTEDHNIFLYFLLC